MIFVMSGFDNRHLRAIQQMIDLPTLAGSRPD